MANTFAVGLLFTLFYCSNLSTARQVPKECSKGPSVWCESLKRAADCGAVGHCIGTVWEKQSLSLRTNDVSRKFVRIFKQLKDVKEFVNADYLDTKISSACRSLQEPALANHCKENSVNLGKYLDHVLKSEVTPETTCTVIGMCNNEKLDAILLGANKKKTESTARKGQLIGSSRCTWGPSYWCSNLSTSHECKAVHHCVTRVWPQIQYPQDNDGICKICTDMVAQARDQLQSNETQEELKQVFEGSCNLIPIKIVRKECDKMADDFVPELVETLASQMNPQAVCSVAGLCNNAKIDEMLERYEAQLALRSGCNNCSRTVSVLRKKFDGTSYEDFLMGLLRVCQKMDSLSDSCSMLVFKYYENILAATRKDLTPQAVCHVSGQCDYRFHMHDDFVFPDVLKEHPVEDDVPCEFCEQLVKHLRDTLVANTTELEFYKVLQGLCKQTGSFKQECLHLAEEYYPLIYNLLTKGLDAQKICKMIGICEVSVEGPVAPLVPPELSVKVFSKTGLIGNDEANSYKVDQLARVPVQSDQIHVAVKEPSAASSPAPLPIERMFVRTPTAGPSKPVCSFCQYFLHYLQVELSDNAVESKITDTVDKACDRLPRSVNDECKTFVNQYGPAVIALLVQEIDPASVCPALGLCPQTEEVRRVDINSDKSNCPLCLFAVEQLDAMLKNNRTEENIRKALEGLCSHLSVRLRSNCVDFVETYSTQLINMLLEDLNAQQICVYLHLCSDNVPGVGSLPANGHKSAIDKFHDRPHLMADRNNFRGKPMLPKHMLENPHAEIETNEIPDSTVNGREVSPRAAKPSTVCVLCEFVMREIDEQIKDKRNEDEIIDVVQGVCRRLPQSLRAQCDDFVTKYGSLLVSLLVQDLAPAKVCAELHMCPEPQDNIAAVREEILDCAVCEAAAAAVKKVLANDRVDRNVVHIVEKSCALLPAKYSNRCHTLLEIYGVSVIQLIEEMGAKQVCQKIGMCSAQGAAYVQMYRARGN